MELNALELFAIIFFALFSVDLVWLLIATVRESREEDAD